MPIYTQHGEKTETTYEGCVLTTRERNYPDDSDFYAVVWDEKNQRITEVEYATTRAWTYNNHATVDATPEVQAKAQAWMRNWLRQRLEEEMALDARQVKVSREVIITKGRKIPIGTIGTVFWKGSVGYTNSTGTYQGKQERVGIATNQGNVFTSINNVEVHNPEQYIQPIDSRLIEANCKRYRLPFIRLGMLVA